MSAARDIPQDCWTCRNRRAVEGGESVFVGIVRQKCKKFGSSERAGDFRPLECVEAYDAFCGGGDWSPTFMARLGIWLGTWK